jgi:predicted ferric reductase
MALDRRGLSVFLCGPAAVVDTFVRRFRQAGVLSRNIHRVHFDGRARNPHHLRVDWWPVPTT